MGTYCACSCAYAISGNDGDGLKQNVSWNENGSYDLNEMGS
jgi:hypothetical protein